MGRTGKVVVLGAVGALLVAAVVSSFVLLRDVDAPDAEAFDVLGTICNGPEDVTVPDGSCAEPLRGRDFASGKASVGLELVASKDARGRFVDYTWVNQTPRIRSFDWRRMSVQSTTGSQLTCLGDDSSFRYEARPGELNRSGYGCIGVLQPGVHVARYAGTEVARITIPAE